MKIEMHDLNGAGAVRTQVYSMPVIDSNDFWSSVTDVPCPITSCDGLVRWAEAGYVPGYRVCNCCGRHFLAKGSAAEPKLLRVGRRRRGMYA